MLRIRAIAAALTLAALGGGLTTATTAVTAGARTVPGVSTLTQIRAAHQLGYDRLVFQFSGGLPAERSARYVRQVIADGSGLPVNVVGSAKLQVRFSTAVGHNDQGSVTYGALRRTYALPEVIQVVNAGDFEAVLSFGVGLARTESFRMFTLTKPYRVVIDVRTPFWTIPVRDYFLDSHRFATGRTPFVRAVDRPVIWPATAFGAMQRLFAGPTQGELARGLRFVSSGATGFKNLTIRDGVARVQLTGPVSSHGSTFTIANEIMPTLKQFHGVHWVKIYDQFGHTERPFGHSDSIPFSLEP